MCLVGPKAATSFGKVLLFGLLFELANKKPNLFLYFNKLAFFCFPNVASKKTWQREREEEDRGRRLIGKRRWQKDRK